MTTATRYTPDQLGFFTDGHACELAADKASRLIADARESGRIDGHYFSDIQDPVQASEAAEVIGYQVAAEYPNVGANDTASREQIYRALIGILDEEAEAAEMEAEELNIEARPGVVLVAGERGWGIYREPAGLGTQFWVNLGRAFYGPFDTLTEATDELAAETKAANAPRSHPTPPAAPGDLALFSGFMAFSVPLVQAGDAVAVTFWQGTGRREPIFGYVRHVDPEDGEATVVDIEDGPVTFHASAAKTVCLIGRKERT